MNEDTTSNTRDKQDNSQKEQQFKRLRMDIDWIATFGLQLPYEISKRSLPAILPETPKSPPFLLLKDAVLVAMSVNKEWIAYVTNHQSNNTKTLLVGGLTKTEETVKFAILARIGLTGIYSMQGRTIEDCNRGYFISVSSTGDRIVLSSMYGEAEKSIKVARNSVSGTDKNSDVESAQTVGSSFSGTGENIDLESAQTVGEQHFSCLVFKVSKKLRVDVDKRTPFTNYQGRAVFLKDDKLALINDKVMTVYDPNNGYKKMYWMDLRSLKSSRGLNSLSTREPFLNPGWAQPIYQFGMREEDNYMKLLHTTRYITQGFLTTYNTGVAQVWSAKGTGTQLISLADDKQEIAGISGDEQFVAKMSKDSEYLGIYHTKTGLLVNRLTQRKIAGVEFDPEQAHYAHFCSKHHFLLWISFKTIPHYNQMYISFELWNISSQILISCQEVVAPLLFRQGWRVEPWVIEQNSQSFIPKFQVYYSTYEGNGAIAFRSIIIDAYTPRQAMVRIIQQQSSSRTQGIDSNANKSSDSQTAGDMNIPESSGSTQNENDNNVDGDGSLQDIEAGDFQNIVWCLKNLSTSRKKNHSLYEHYQVENALDDYDNLTCYKMYYHGIKYLLRLGTHTVQLWRLPTPFEAEQLLYIRAVKPASEPFTQDYDYKWIRSIQREHLDSVEDLVAFAKALQPSERGRIEIRVCSEEHVDKPDDATKSYLDEVYLPLEELMQSEIDMEKWKAKGKLSANAYNIQQNSSGFQFKCVQYHYIESVCQSLHYLCMYPKTKEVKHNKETVENLVRQTIKIVENTIREMQKVKSNYFTTISGSNTLAMLASFDIGREILFDILETEALPISLFSYVRHNAKTEQRDERITRKENALTVLIEKARIRSVLFTLQSTDPPFKKTGNRQLFRINRRFGVLTKSRCARQV